jgi:hypothetical protein
MSLNCKLRWTTYEVYENYNELNMQVVRKLAEISRIASENVNAKKSSS